MWQILCDPLPLVLHTRHYGVRYRIASIFLARLTIKICVICGSRWPLLCASAMLVGAEVHGDVITHVEIPVAGRHLSLSATVWNSALFQTQPRAAVDGSSRFRISPGPHLFLAWSNIFLCRHT